MSIFNSIEYREALKRRIEQMKKRPGTWTMAKLAERAGVQPSYLSHVLNGRADFNSDQLYGVCEHLNCTSEETHYLLLLLEHERSAHPKRKAELNAQIKKIRSESLKIAEQVNAQRVNEFDRETAAYYLDPFCQVVHVFLNFPQYAKEPEAIARKLGLTDDHLAEILGRLEGAGFIETGPEGYNVLIRNRHLPKESPLCQPHQFLMRYKSIDQMQRVPIEERVGFSVTFSSTPEDKERIHRAFLDFIKTTEKIVKESQRQNVYQINFDLFPWELI